MSFYKNRYLFKTKNLSISTLKELFLDSRLSYINIVLLFGSRALGTNHDKSDYDFVVFSDQELNNPWGDSAKFWDDFSSILPLHECDYDIIDLSNATPLMKKSIQEGYIILKGDQNEIQRLLDENKTNS